MKNRNHTIGETITYDGNARGVTPCIKTATILEIKKGFATSGDPAQYIYKIRNENGNVFYIDEFQVNKN